MLEYQRLQKEFSDHLRNPECNPPPAGVEDRRLAVYRDLIYNNIEGFIASAFPVLREITPDEPWHAMVRDFVHLHQSSSPYFLEISQEFLLYLQNEREPQAGDWPFLLELAHYEWVELALDVAVEELPAKPPAGTLIESVLEVSPLVWCLSYAYPVHRIGPEFIPETPPSEPTFLLVYRNREDEVSFMLSNAATVRLLKLLQSGPMTGRQAILQMAEALKSPDPDQLLAYAQTLLAQLYEQDIIWPRN